MRSTSGSSSPCHARSAPKRGAPGPAPSRTRATRLAAAHATGEEKAIRIGVMGTQSDFACSRPHCTFAWKFGRTSNRKVCPCSVATPEGVETPGPHWSFTSASAGNRCLAARTMYVFLRSSGESVESTSSRSAPVRMRTPMGSWIPAAENATCFSTDSSVGTASRRSRNAWSSTMVAFSQGVASRIAGPPVVNAKLRVPSTGRPASVRRPAVSSKRQRRPPARGSGKS